VDQNRAQRNHEVQRTGKDMQDVPGGKVNILGGHSIAHSEQRNVYIRVSY
jgi:hypothetical protein